MRQNERFSTGHVSPPNRNKLRSLQSMADTLIAGAPLDFIKLAAVIAMVGAHANVAIADDAYPLMWRISRISFPLFCFAIACNLRRGTAAAQYVQVLILLAAVTQPIYAFLIPGIQSANVLFTLAIGVAIAHAMRTLRAQMQHAIFIVGIAATFTLPSIAQSGAEFGIVGMLLPAAILLVLEGHIGHVAWLLLLVLGLNWDVEPTPGQPSVSDAVMDAIFAGLGGLLVLSIAGILKNRRRFLPRYALHVFYPGHLAILALIRELIS